MDNTNKTILFESFPKQDEFLAAVFSFKFDIILYGGAIRGGKTFAGLGALILLCKKYPSSRWAVVRKDLPTIKKNTLPSWDKIKPSNRIRHYNQELQTVTFQNGSQIIFFPENYTQDKELNRWKGLEVNGFLLEEVNELQEASFNKAIERAGSYIVKEGEQPKRMILCTCNPSHGWVKERFYDRWKNSTLPTKWLYIPSRIFDNPHIPKDYIDGLRDLPAYEYRVFVEGDWDVKPKSGKEFYKYFDINKHIQINEYNCLLPVHLSFDENVTPYFTCTVWQIVGKELKLIDEICLKNPRNTVKDTCAEFKSRYASHTSGMFIYGDATSQKEDVKLEKGYNLYRIIMENLSQYKPSLRVLKSNPSIVMRGNFINEIFRANQGGIKISLHEKCTNTLNDFIYTIEASDGTKLKSKVKDPITKQTYEEYGHCTDSADYIICSAFAQEYEEYQRGGSIINIRTSKRTTQGSY